MLPAQQTEIVVEETRKLVCGHQLALIRGQVLPTEASLASV
jgi:hypothetical protein